MDEAKINIHLPSDDDEFKQEIGHMYIYENPASPDTSPGTSRAQTPDPSHDKSDDSNYYADTIKDSPKSTDTTFELQDDSEVGGPTGVGNLQCHEQLDSSDTSVGDKGSDDSNEAHGIAPNESTIIQTFDKTDILFSPAYKRLKKRAEKSEAEH